MQYSSIGLRIAVELTILHEGSQSVHGLYTRNPDVQCETRKP